MATRTPAILIGDLLVKAELITLAQLADAIPIAKRTGLPVGRVLVGSEFISDINLQAALNAQSLIRDGFLQTELAARALRVVAETGLPLEDALRKEGWRSEYFELTNKLGQLLFDSGLVSKTAVEEALQTCFTTGLPLGRILVLKGALSESLAYAALSAQILIRDGKLTRNRAVHSLRTTRERQMGESSADGKEMQRFHPTQTVRLGELLALAGLVSELDLLSSVERGLVEDTPIGQILVNQKLVSEQNLEHALKLQDMVSSRQLSPMQAAEALKLLQARTTSLACVIAEVMEAAEAQSQSIDAAELIRLMGLVPPKDVMSAIQEAHSSGRLTEEVLLERNKIDAQQMHVVTECKNLIINGRLTVEQAVFAMHCWVWSNREAFDLVLDKLGWVHAAES
jgi:hypothetical protein